MQQYPTLHLEIFTNFLTENKTIDDDIAQRLNLKPKLLIVSPLPP